MGDTAFHLLAKPTGSACNLACEYCFFLGKSGLYPGQLQRMPGATLDVYLRQLFDSHPDGEVGVAFQGGEPLLKWVSTSFARPSLSPMSMPSPRPGSGILDPDERHPAGCGMPVDVVDFGRPVDADADQEAALRKELRPFRVQQGGVRLDRECRNLPGTAVRVSESDGLAVEVEPMSIGSPP